MPRLPALACCLLLSLFLATACTPTPMPVDDATTRFVILRHAEKLADAGDDPGLSEAGMARAAAIATMLAGEHVTGVYATGYARTQQTATPTALAHGIPLSTHDAGEAYEATAGRLKAAHDTGTVLVVGHSNTVPGIAAALCGCEVPSMEETEYDRKMVVTIDAQGQATLAIGKQAEDPGP